MRRIIRAGVALVTLCSASATTATASDISECMLAISNASIGYVRMYQAKINDCLRFGSYADCEIDWMDLQNPQAVLDEVLNDSGSPCAAALGGGGSVGDFWPATCSGDPFYPSYDPRYACTSPVGNSGSLWECIDCQSWRLGERMRFALDLPTVYPESIHDRRCIRSVTSAFGKAVRTALREATDCAADSGDPPWSCTLDLAADSKFSRALLSLGRKAAKCRDSAGIVGSLAPKSRQICNTALASPAELAACLAQAATCESCLAMNVALGENLDCAAIAGAADCRLDAPKPEQGDFAVANRDDSTVSLYDRDGNPRNGTLAASTFAADSSPIDVLMSEKTNTVFTVSESAETVTGLHAGTGDPIHGTLAASTVSVGAAPVAIAVNPELDLLYVANSGDNTVTFLDAADLSYAFGTKVASTFSVGADPSALAVKTDGTVLYVANAGAGTISYLDAATGAPLFGTLATSSFTAGTQPSALLSDSGLGALAVADAADGRLRALDLDTGAALDIDDGPSALLGGQPIALASNGNFYAASATGTDVQTWSASRGTEPVLAGGAVSDVAIGYSYETWPGIDSPLLVTLPDSDEVVLSNAISPLSNLGVSPAENSTVPNDHGYRNWVYDAGRDQFFATTCENDPAGRVGAINASTLATTQLFDVPECPSDVAFGPSADNLYVSTYDGDVTFLDAATGAGRFGTLANSTFSCPCSYGGINQVVVNEPANRVYLRCSQYVAYMDATTGACLGGSAATTGLFADIASMVFESMTGKLFFNTTCPYSGEYQKIFSLDPVTPQFVGGSAEASKLPGPPTYVCGGDSVRAPGDGNLYAYTGSSFHKIDAATGNTLTSATIPYRPVTSLEVDADHGLVRLHYWNGHPKDFVLYRNISDFDYTGGDFESSRLEVPRFGCCADLVPAPGSDYSLIVNDDIITRVRRDSLGFSDNSRTLGGTIVPTGDHPSAVASMSALTGH